MPPRYLTLLIVGFWLTTTSWMFYRDLWPRLRPGEPPAITLDLTAEVSASTTSWTVLHKGERVGYAKTDIHRQQDRTFLLVSEVRFETQKLPEDQKFLGGRLKKIVSTTRITAAGELREVSYKVKVALVEETEIEISGPVEQGLFTPRVQVWVAGHEVKEAVPFKLAPVPVPEQGNNVHNPLLPMNKMPGLRKGQQWQVPVVSPLAAAGSSLPSLGQGTTAQTLHAEVFGDALAWGGLNVPCWRIDYAEPGKRPRARTWVRQRDGLVLQHDLNEPGIELVLQREEKK